MTYFTRLVIASFLFCFSAAIGLSQQSNQKRQEEQEQSTLHQDISSLKQTQQQILSELQQIKKLLEAKQESAVDGAAAHAVPVELKGEPFRGDKNARIAIVEYSDFQCPYCGEYIRETYPLINERYIKTGRVKYFFHDLPLSNHPNALPAAQAARCAGDQGKFWEMHDRLFANQSALAPSDVARYAQSLGLDKPKFNQCLASGRYADTIRASVTGAEKLGIDGTPAFLIGAVGPDGEGFKVEKIIVGAESFDSFKAVLDDLLKAQGR